MRADAEIGNRPAAGEVLPGLVDVEVDAADARFLGDHQRVGRLPDLDRIGAVGNRVADQARRRRVHDLDLGEIDTRPLLEEFRHLVVRGRARAGQLLALKVLQRLHVVARGDDRAPVVEQVEQVLHLDAAHVGETQRGQRGAAADLELTGVELRRVGVGRAFLEADVEPVRDVELLRLDHRRQQRAERGRRKDHDGEFIDWLGAGTGRDTKNQRRGNGEAGKPGEMRGHGVCP